MAALAKENLREGNEHHPHQSVPHCFKTTKQASGALTWASLAMASGALAGAVSFARVIGQPRSRSGGRLSQAGTCSKRFL